MGAVSGGRRGAGGGRGRRGAGVVGGAEAEAGDGGDFAACVKEGEAAALPRGDAEFLQEFFQAAAAGTANGAAPLAPLAVSDPPETIGGKAQTDGFGGCGRIDGG